MKNEKKEMQAPSRLSLADFKVKAIENKNEIEKIVGGVAAGCHRITVDPTAPDLESTFD